MRYMGAFFLVFVLHIPVAYELIDIFIHFDLIHYVHINYTYLFIHLIVFFVYKVWKKFLTSLFSNMHSFFVY